MSGRRSRWRPGTAARLSALLGLILAAVLVVVTVVTERAITDRTLAGLQRDLSAEVGGFARATAGRTPGGLRPAATAYLSSAVLPRGEWLLVALPGGGQLGSAGSAALLTDRALRPLLAHPPARTTTMTLSTSGRPLLVSVTPVTLGGHPVGALVAAADLGPLQGDRHRILWLVGAEALVALVAAVAGSYLLLRRLLRTVGHMTSTADAVGSGDLDQRLGDPGTGDELAQLAATLDTMLDRLATALESQRRLLSDVSHQLRTPLTVIRGHLEVLARVGADDPAEVRQTTAVVVAEVDHVQALVERLLLLGRALEPDFLDPEPLDLRTAMAELGEAARVLAGRRQVVVEETPDLLLEVDRTKLRGALLNLVDNAVRATGPDDSLVLWASRDGCSGEVRLGVDDTGPGIDPARREAVRGRFARPGAVDREGSGLGLAIVTAVAEAHGGRLELGTAPSGGCRAEIVLPARRVLPLPAPALAEA